MSNRNQGFTLIELIVTLAVLAISIAVAAPVFTATLDSVRERTLLDQLLADIHFARSAAIARRRPVSICTGDEACSGEANWSGPVFIFDDLNGNGALDDGDSPLRGSMIGNNYQWSWSNFRKQPHLTFKPDGTTHSLNGSFVLCRRGMALKKIVINITGRVKLESPNATDRCT
ncbi:GspH/FimT family pseudopilin [Pseudomonas stutzeri]|jgi:type IV fimbrial biogenesis protein FimT|nr:MULTISPECIES: GspH/FimT family pseudopilin [Pseudomonadaceae]MCF0015265.1 GspH/FimT family pseudopilin [Stutzerimonas stutzeri]MCF0020456.1 GspH/FimT family pseudopilin [Stutzerimonas stutzeri]MCQ4299914.1 GspH/FimT family pseudopilin [Pseudomonas songnenensis]